ncbi:MAG: T9SS C-terminal target domain-containing protein [Calditrichaeota bacterium]|nr:MAG: T9SS C-terminal target domain-containing protein [Calditrichota bacterium]
MKKSAISIVIMLCLFASFAFAQIFPPEWVQGPFPTGTEPVRGDAPCEISIPDVMGTFHEYTAYRGTPVVDGNVDDDPVWNSIPWTVFDQYTVQETAESCYIFDGACEGNQNYWGADDITAWFKILWDDDHVYFALKKIDNEYKFDETHMTNLGSIWMDDAYQIVLDANSPDDIGGPMPSAEIGLALLDYTETAYNSWRNTNGDPLALAEGNGSSSIEACDGKAFFGTHTDNDAGGYTEILEVALVKWDEIIADEAQMMSIMANDLDEDHIVDALEWSRGIFHGKTADRYASILYSSSEPPAGLTDITDLGGTIVGSNDALPWTGPNSDGSPDAERIEKLIDNDVNTKYLVGAEQSWIDYEISDLALLSEYTITSANDTPARDLRSWELLGWDAGTGAWVTLHTVTDQDVWEERFMTKKWTFENTDKWFSKFRLNILAINFDTEGLMQMAELELLGEIKSAVNDKEPTAPTEFALQQNYPNPFNPTTTISYAVKTMGNVELQVYDVLGHQVETLVNEVQNAGNYQVIFDAKDLPTGIYLYTLRSAQSVLSQKMVLMR